MCIFICVLWYEMSIDAVAGQRSEVGPACFPHWCRSNFRDKILDFFTKLICAESRNTTPVHNKKENVCVSENPAPDDRTASGRDDF